MNVDAVAARQEARAAEGGRPQGRPRPLRHERGAVRRVRRLGRQDRRARVSEFDAYYRDLEGEDSMKHGRRDTAGRGAGRRCGAPERRPRRRRPASAAGSRPATRRCRSSTSRASPRTEPATSTSTACSRGLYRTDSAARRGGPQRQRDSRRRLRARALQPRRRHHLGQARRRPRAAAARVLLPVLRQHLQDRARSASPTPTRSRWRYYVKLDPAFIDKAMWAEVSPNGKLLWTSNGAVNGGTTCSPTT